MSKEQAIGSTIIIAKELLNLIWKRFDEGDVLLTWILYVPDKKNIIDMERAREALAISSIVEKITKATVVNMMMGPRNKGQGPFQSRAPLATRSFNPFHNFQDKGIPLPAKAHCPGHPQYCHWSLLSRSLVLH